MADDDLPIDIHSSKLLDWLVSRRHCSRDWQKKVMELREKIKLAISDMPENEAVVGILQSNYINYFHVKKILSILCETEKGTKNFLGYYSSQRMKDWKEIESLYCADSVNLAEAAQILQRLVQYELPALKKAIAKSNAAVEEEVRKEQDYRRLAADAKKTYEKELARLGIEGKKLRAELLSLAVDLPSFFTEVSRKIADLQPAVEYYSNFRAYLMGESNLSPLLPLLALVIAKGSSLTVFEWKYGKAPIRVETTTLDLLLLQDSREPEVEEDCIDFGDDQIDFGDGEIDFGEGDEAAINVVADENGLVVEEEVARGEEAQGVLENENGRRAVLQQIKELSYFLSSRLADEETEAAADIFTLGLEQRPKQISQVTPQDMRRWLTNISSIQKSLNDPHKTNLFKIRSSPQYVETLVEEMTMRREQEGRYKQMAALMTQKQVTSAELAEQQRIQLEKLIQNTKELKEQIEKEISDKYKGRPVHIMGGIAQALQVN